jgi:uncharacterized protein YndB with AHSA1/START domain
MMDATSRRATMAAKDDSASGDFNAEQGADSTEFVISRLFDAPRELVFRMWTEAEHLKKWFGPSGFTIPVCHLNLVPGGAFHYCMRGPNGSEMWGKWVFQEIETPQWIVQVNTFSNKHGNITRHPYVPDWPLEMLATTTFDEQEGKTLVKLVSLPVNPTAAEQRMFDTMHDAMAQGWNGTFDQLAAYLTTLSN